jgi:hypothetical protein
MSKLTNCQISALIPGMEHTLADALRRGKRAVARRVEKRLDEYRAELEQRQGAGLNPGAEIQESRIVPALKVNS